MPTAVAFLNEHGKNEAMEGEKKKAEKKGKKKKKKKMLRHATVAVTAAQPLRERIIRSSRFARPANARSPCD